jgi:hypothetical protein
MSEITTIKKEKTMGNHKNTFELILQLQDGLGLSLMTADNTSQVGVCWLVGCVD